MERGNIEELTLPYTLKSKTQLMQGNSLVIQEFNKLMKQL